MLIICNFKSNRINQTYIDRISDIKTNNKIILLPNIKDINDYDFSSINYGSQNIIDKTYKYVLLGHHDVRDKEDNNVINKKVLECITLGINVILCVNSLDALKKDIKNIDNFKNIIIAYEKDEYIGSNNILEIDKIDKFIKEAKKITKGEAKIVYGGGISKCNIKKLYTINSLDGIIIGTACNNIDDLISIIELVNN